MNQATDTYDRLRSIRMFAGFADDECNRLLEVMRPRSLESGAVIFEQGASGDTLVVVMDGILRVEVADHQGQSATVATIQQGEVVGEMAVLDPAPRSATVVAATDCQLLELSRDGLEKLRKISPSASATIVGTIISDVTRRLRNVNKRIDKELAPHKQRKKAFKTTLASKSGEGSSFISKLLKRVGR